MRRLFVALCFLPLVFVSCASNEVVGFGSVVRGIVTDEDGNPVPDFKIFSGIECVSVTDEKGMFSIPFSPGDKIKIVGRKAGWRRISVNEKFRKQNKLYWLTARKIDSDLLCALDFIESGKFSEAEKRLDALGSENKKSAKVIFLKSYLEFKSGKYKAAYSIIRNGKKFFDENSETRLRPYEDFLEKKCR